MNLDFPFLKQASRGALNDAGVFATKSQTLRTENKLIKKPDEHEFRIQFFYITTGYRIPFNSIQFNRILDWVLNCGSTTCELAFFFQRLFFFDSCFKFSFLKESVI